MSTPRASLQRIAIVGTSGSGKTTLALQLSKLLGLPHVELDALHWDAGWQPAPTAIFQARAELALGGERWVVDGNYPEVRDTIWQRADTVVWLDYGLPLVLWRLATRTVRRVSTDELLWNGNRERSLRAHLLSRNSIFLWALRTHPQRQREYGALFAGPRGSHLQRVRLPSPRATNAWLAHLGSQAVRR